MITHTINGVVRPRVAAARFVAVDTRLDEAIALRYCAMYRKAFRGSAVSYPADVLRFDAVADWIRNHGLTVDVASPDDLDRVRRADIKASQVVMHCHDADSVSLYRAGFARFVVDSREQIAALADNPLARTQRVVVDATSSHDLASEVVEHRRLLLVGVHYRLDDTNPGELANAVVAMIARMAWIGRKHALILTRLSLGDVGVERVDADVRSLRRVAQLIDESVEDGCIRYRFPRPALTVSPRLQLP